MCRGQSVEHTYLPIPQKFGIGRRVRCIHLAHVIALPHAAATRTEQEWNRQMKTTTAMVAAMVAVMLAGCSSSTGSTAATGTQASSATQTSTAAGVQSACVAVDGMVGTDRTLPCA